MRRWHNLVIAVLLVACVQGEMAQASQDITGGPVQKWRVAFKRDRLSVPAYLNGVVYVNEQQQGREVRLVALDGETGEELWGVASGGGSDPAIWKDTVLVGNSYGDVQAFDALTGRLVWTYSFWTDCGSGDRPNCTLEVRVADGLAFVKDWNWSEVRALDVATGAVIWKATLPEERAFPGLAAGDGRVVILGIDRIFRALDAHSGDVLWEYEYGSSHLNTVDIDIIGGRLYAALYDGSSSELMAIDLENGPRIWDSAMPGGIRRMGVSTEENLVLVSAFEEVLALDLDSGVEQWHVPIIHSFPPVVAGDITYVGIWEALFALETATGREIRRLELEDADGRAFNGAVLGDNGVLYVTSYDHMLFAFDVGAG
jgi:outer membrane protein assembly factor BamB